jgi:hypothetical protein
MKHSKNTSVLAFTVICKRSYHFAKPSTRLIIPTKIIYSTANYTEWAGDVDMRWWIALGVAGTSAHATVPVTTVDHLGNNHTFCTKTPSEHLSLISKPPSEIINAMEATNEFSPAIPIPAEPLDVQERIQQLRGYLDPKNPDYQPERQHINIKAVIKLYEDGKIDGVEPVFIMNGKIVPEKEIFKGPSCSWSEGEWHQYAQVL